MTTSACQARTSVTFTACDYRRIRRGFWSRRSWPVIHAQAYLQGPAKRLLGTHPRDSLVRDRPRQVVGEAGGWRQGDDRMARVGAVVEPDPEVRHEGGLPAESEPRAVRIDQTGGPNSRVGQCIQLAAPGSRAAACRPHIRAPALNRPP